MNSQYLTAEYVWLNLLATLAADNGGSFYSTTAEFADVEPALRGMISEGWFNCPTDDLDGDYWMAAAGEPGATSAHFAASKHWPAVNDVLDVVFDRPQPDDEEIAQPASVAVPDGYALVPRDLLQLIHQSWRIPNGHPKKVSESAEEMIASGIARVRALLDAAPHPVSGEQRSDELHRLDKQCRDDVARAMGMTPVGDGYPWSCLLAGIKIMAKNPKAQDVSMLVEALKHARIFIRNGIDLGFIRMPDADTPDPAHNTLPNIDEALAAYCAQQGEQP